jgi:hypothetical protein
MQTLTARFDGKARVPDTPLDMPGGCLEICANDRARSASSFR